MLGGDCWPTCPDGVPLMCRIVAFTELLSMMPLKYIRQVCEL